MPRVFDSQQEHFGRYLDEYKPGDVFRHWPGHTITEAEDHMFCLLTRAVSPLHVDRRFAQDESAFGGRVSLTPPVKPSRDEAHGPSSGTASGHSAFWEEDQGALPPATQRAKRSTCA